MVDVPNGVIQAPAMPASGTPAPAEPPVSSAPADGNQTGEKVVPIAALHDERTKRQEAQAQLSSLQAEIAALKAGFTAPAPGMTPGMPGMAPQQYQQPPQQDPLAQVWESNLWDTDPKKAVRSSVQAEIMTALSWYDSQHQAVAQQEAKTMKDHTDYGQYKERVDQYLRNIPLEQRGRPGVVEMAYFAVKGQYTDQILTKQQSDLIERIRKGEMVQGLTPGAFTPAPPAANAGAQLTEDQLKTAAMMNLTPEQYASAIVVRK